MPTPPLYRRTILRRLPGCPEASLAWAWQALVAFALGTASAWAAEGEGRRDVAFFESKIRPILVKRCYECHSAGAKQVHAGLRLDSRAGILQGGDSGAAIVPGQPAKSLLIETISHKGDIQMPPAGKLPAAEIDLLTEWIQGDAPLPSDEALVKNKSGIDFARGRKFWSFQHPTRRELPTVPRTDRLAQPIDAFIAAELQKSGLSPTEQANRRALIRRATYDLTGLPPTPDEVEHFAADARPDAWEHLIDRLLASPHYGERWGRHWLDHSRYADGNTSSLEARGQAWLYRDWIIAALNADLPYDQFVRRQFAADQIAECQPADLAALGFLGISPEYWKELQLAPAVIETIVADEWEERLDAIGRTFLGLSIACARCHDHKFDPISTEDYYALAGVLASTQLTERYVVSEPEAEVVRQAVAKVTALREELAKLNALKAKTDENNAKINELLTHIASIESTTPRYSSAKAHAVIDAALHVLPAGKNHTKLEYKPGESLNLCVHIRGNPARPGTQVPRRFLTVFSGDQPQAFQHGSGRLELADAILNEGAPLSARVIVNRVWKHHFGRGLVETVSDFGTQGAKPSHAELLDDLTARFIEQGWSLKWLHRQLLLSATYQQASTYSRDKFLADPDNRGLWRMNRRRLEIEAWRDSLLAAGGNLDSHLGGPPVVLAAANNRRRTLYAKIDRADVEDVLRLFDFPDPATHSPEREPTTTPLQQLFVLNSPFMRQQALGLARQLLAAGQRSGDRQSSEAVVQGVYRRLFAREATANELHLGRKFLEKPELGEADLRHVQDYCQALLGSNEFLFVD